MPTENDGQTAKPIPSATPTPKAAPAPQGNTGFSGDFTPERVDLPSAPAAAAIYAGTPLAAGFIHVRPITTKEEEILATPRFWMQGNALDLVMSRCVMTPGVNTLEMLSGDRTHLLMYLRSISYGPKYSFEMTMKDGSRQMIETDVSRLSIKQLPADFVEPYTVQLDGTTYELKLSRGHQEQAIIRARLLARKKDPKNAAEPSPSESLKQLIVSVNGTVDAKDIARHVDTMISGKAHRLRALIAAASPGPKLDLDVTNEQTGEVESIGLQITEAFFRP